MRRFRRFAAVIAAVAVASTALIGFAHTRAGRPLLALLGRTKVGACPLGYGHDPEARRRALDRVRGDVPANGRPALGFVLEGTSRADLLGWASAHGVSCTGRPHVPALTCTDVPASALPDAFGSAEVSSLFVELDEHDRVVSIGTVRRLDSADAAATVARTIESRVATLAGPPANRTGEATAAFLEAGLLRQERAEFRFRDYHAATSVTNMGGGRFVVSEKYESIPL